MLYNTNRFFSTLADLKDLLKDYDMKVVEVKAQTGYISRKTRALTERDNTPVYVAGGNRKGQLYYLIPRYDTNRYCWRCYLNVMVDDIKK